MKQVITYSDYRNRPTKLTDKELQWFYGIVEKARAVTGCTVPIITYDHELYEGKHKDALGCCCTTDPSNPLGEGVETIITIDCYFINECYRHEFYGDFLIAGETLVEVIAHEIAHLKVWRHGKKHTQLTSELTEKIKAA